MNYTEITDKVFEIFNAIIPKIFELHKQFEYELASLPQNDNPLLHLQQSNMTRKQQNSKVSDTVAAYLNKTLPNVVPQAALWFKGTKKPNCSSIWIISPYEFDIMGCAIMSIALQHEEKLEMSILANFTHSEVITAATGEGSQIENEKIQVDNNLLSPQASVMQFIIPPATVKGSYAALVAPLNKKFNLRTIVNNVAENIPHYITLVARGKLDMVLATGFQYQDVAAAICIAEHSGAIVTDFSGNCNGLYSGESLICCNKNIHAQIKVLMK